jgi:integrase
MNRRTKLAPGVYQDAYGISVIASVGTYPKNLTSPELRFAIGTPLPTLVAAWHREKMKLMEALEHRGGRAGRGTLAADVLAYFKTARLSPQRQQERDHQLTWWCVDQGFGTRRRSTLTATELTQALNTLHGTAASTRNHYRTALSNVFTVLDGKNAPNPFRDVPRVEEPPAARRDQPYELIEVLLAKLRDRGGAKGKLSRTKAWLRVLAYVPVTPAQLLLLRRSDVHWTEGAMGAISVAGREKGAGTQPKRKPLFAPEALEALRAFDAAGCWDETGHVRLPKPSASSRLRTFKAALTAAVQELRVTRPDLDLSRADEMLVKDLRHSLLTEVLRVTGNLDITAEFGDHKDKATTLRYAQGAVAGVLKTAGAQLAEAFAARPRYVPPPSGSAPRPGGGGSPLPFLSSICPPRRSGRKREISNKNESSRESPKTGRAWKTRSKSAI